MVLLRFWNNLFAEHSKESDTNLYNETQDTDPHDLQQELSLPDPFVSNDGSII